MLDADQKSIQQINFAGNLDVNEAKKSILDFSQGTVRVLYWEYYKIVQSLGFLGRLLEPLLKTGWPLMKNVLNPLANSVLLPLGLTAVAAAADAGIH